MQKYKKLSCLCFLCFIVLASGCVISVPSSMNTDSLFQCQDDTDCVSEEIACNNCGCPRAVNKEYKVDVDCTKLNSNDPVAKYGCNLGCPVVKPRCINQICVMK